MHMSDKILTHPAQDVKKCICDGVTYRSISGHKPGCPLDWVDRSAMFGAFLGDAREVVAAPKAFRDWTAAYADGTSIFITAPNLEGAKVAALRVAAMPPVTDLLSITDDQKHVWTFDETNPALLDAAAAREEEWRDKDNWRQDQWDEGADARERADERRTQSDHS